jgi:hypothetical protein
LKKCKKKIRRQGRSVPGFERLPERVLRQKTSPPVDIARVFEKPLEQGQPFAAADAGGGAMVVIAIKMLKHATTKTARTKIRLLVITLPTQLKANNQLRRQPPARLSRVKSPLKRTPRVTKKGHSPLLKKR